MKYQPEYMEYDEVKKLYPTVQTIEDYTQALEEKEPTVIMRDYDEPTSPPFLEGKVEIFDFKKDKRPDEDVKRAYGTKGNIPGIDVLNAIREFIGAGGYCIHIADSSYTDYSIWEVREFIKNFDNTNLRVWMPETFDCDDFSQVLQGNINGFFPGIAFGTIWYGPRNPPPYWGHSVNLFYHHKEKAVYLVEPQSNTFYKFNKDIWKPWMIIL
ncbi:MAG: hypothetical protein JSV49_10805 [Thermoplasmata archaeon]|nr:MAG: hypothetical protein JSV49_10805 [Thermoplasmata archaeon]